MFNSCLYSNKIDKINTKCLVSGDNHSEKQCQDKGSTPVWGQSAEVYLKTYILIYCKYLGNTMLNLAAASGSGPFLLSSAFVS